jgi:aspartate aminotransferase, mitochondrial
MGPLDPIIGLNETYNKDDFPLKQIVGVGAYRDGAGKPYMLPSVRKAEKLLYDQNLVRWFFVRRRPTILTFFLLLILTINSFSFFLLALNATQDMEYSGIAGDPKFVDLSLKFAYGEDCPLLKNKHIQGVQALSGTGGLRVMGELLHRIGNHTTIYVPNPTWGNHKAIFNNSGLKVESYRYYSGTDLDHHGMVQDIKKMPVGSAILLHACAHNPTGTCNILVLFPILIFSWPSRWSVVILFSFRRALTRHSILFYLPSLYM